MLIKPILLLGFILSSFLFAETTIQFDKQLENGIKEMLVHYEAPKTGDKLGDDLNQIFLKRYWEKVFSDDRYLPLRQEVIEGIKKSTMKAAVEDPKLRSQMIGLAAKGNISKLKSKDIPEDLRNLWMRSALGNAGPLMHKYLQLAGDYLGDDLDLKKIAVDFKSDIPPISKVEFDQIKSDFIREMEKRGKKVVVSDKPIGVGSVAQVQLITYPDQANKRSAAKFIKPSAKRKLPLEDDLLQEILQDPGYEKFLKKFIADFTQSVKKEMDLKNEDANLEKAKIRYASEDIVIPEVEEFEGQEGKQFIVQSYVPGEGLDRLEKAHSPHMPSEALREKVAGKWLGTSFFPRPHQQGEKAQLGFAHGDPHFGNLRYDDAHKKMGMIDWGAASDIPDVQRLAMMKIGFVEKVLNEQNPDEDQIVDYLVKVAQELQKSNSGEEIKEKELRQALRNYLNKADGGENFILEVLKVFLQNNVSFDPTLIDLARGRWYLKDLKKSDKDFLSKLENQLFLEHASGGTNPGCQRYQGEQKRPYPYYHAAKELVVQFARLSEMRKQSGRVTKEQKREFLKKNSESINLLLCNEKDAKNQIKKSAAMFKKDEIFNSFVADFYSNPAFKQLIKDQKTLTPQLIDFLDQKMDFFSFVDFDDSLKRIDEELNNKYEEGTRKYLDENKDTIVRRLRDNAGSEDYAQLFRVMLENIPKAPTEVRYRLFENLVRKDDFDNDINQQTASLMIGSMDPLTIKFMQDATKYADKKNNQRKIAIKLVDKKGKIKDSFKVDIDLITTEVVTNKANWQNFYGSDNKFKQEIDDPKEFERLKVTLWEKWNKSKNSKGDNAVNASSDQSDFATLASNALSQIPPMEFDQYKKKIDDLNEDNQDLREKKIFIVKEDQLASGSIGQVHELLAFDGEVNELRKKYSLEGNGPFFSVPREKFKDIEGKDGTKAKRAAIKILKIEGREESSKSLENLKLSIDRDPTFSPERKSLLKELLQQQYNALANDFNGSEEGRKIGRGVEVYEMKNFGVTVPGFLNDKLGLKSRNDVVVTEFFEGENLNKFRPENEEDYRKLGKNLDVFYRNFLKNGLFNQKFSHGDAHSGNILVSKEKGLGVIDLGTSVEFTASQAQGLMELTQAISLDSDRYILKALLKLAKFKRTVNGKEEEIKYSQLSSLEKKAFEKNFAQRIQQLKKGERFQKGDMGEKMVLLFLETIKANQGVKGEDNVVVAGLTPIMPPDYFLYAKSLGYLSKSINKNRADLKNYCYLFPQGCKSKSKIPRAENTMKRVMIKELVKGTAFHYLTFGGFFGLKKVTRVNIPQAVTSVSEKIWKKATDYLWGKKENPECP